MADLGGTFDSDTVDPHKARELLEPAWYLVTIVKSDVVETKAGDGKYLKLELDIDESRHPEHKGRKIWENLNLWHAKPSVSDIAQRSLSAICRAVGVPKIDNSEQLHHRPMAVLIGVRPAKDGYDAQNNIKGYEVPEKVNDKSSAPTGSAPQGTGSKSAPAEEPVSKTPPWVKS